MIEMHNIYPCCNVVLPGVELGLEKMKRMETAILTLKPQYGFKHHGNKELGENLYLV